MIVATVTPQAGRKGSESRWPRTPGHMQFAYAMQVHLVGLCSPSLNAEGTPENYRVTVTGVSQEGAIVVVAGYLVHTYFMRYSPPQLPTLTSVRLPGLYAYHATLQTGSNVENARLSERD
ncbi:hypothetical protein BD413DRAFT_241734 [Trametes elegans]|nr:hypothetical protein BD413DRAFT_241734 [Trametes elegans]